MSHSNDFQNTRILILRGLVRESRHWHDFPKVLEDKIIAQSSENASMQDSAQSALQDSQKVFTLDYPGFGTEYQRTSPATIEGIMLDTRLRFLQLKDEYPGKWSIMAISLGGMVLMKWAEKFPEDFKHWFIVNSSARKLSPLWKRFLPRAIPKVLKIALSRNLVTNEEVILKMTTNLKQDELQKIASVQAGFYRDQPYSKKNALRQLWGASKFTPAKKLSIQATVIVSDADKLVSPDCSKAISDQYNFPLIHHKTANHDLAMDDSSWLADVMAEKLK